MLLAAGEGDVRAPSALTALGALPAQVVVLATSEDQHLLVQRPWQTSGLLLDVWLAVWQGSAGG